MTWRIQGLSVTIERNDIIQGFLIVTSFFTVVMVAKKQKWKQSQFIVSNKWRGRSVTAVSITCSNLIIHDLDLTKKPDLRWKTVRHLRQDSGSRSAFCGRFKQLVKQALTQNSIISGDYQKEFQNPDVRWYLKIPCTFLRRILWCWQQLCLYVVSHV